jgi:pyridoxamine 5'-phosphate oxidase
MSNKLPPDVEVEPLYNDLNLVHARAWELLSRAAVDRKSQMHTIQVATVGLDGSPKLRSVILRKVNADARTLIFHTDTRSAKVVELQKDPRIAFHAYDFPKRTQIRIEGVAKLHTSDPLANTQWTNSQQMSRECYRVPVAPGSVMEQPHISDIYLPDGRENFCVVVIQTLHLEWLLLHHVQHRRARFDYADHQESTYSKGVWLGP